jgi:hypothetical protein
MNGSEADSPWERAGVSSVFCHNRLKPSERSSTLSWWIGLPLGSNSFVWSAFPEPLRVRLRNSLTEMDVPELKSFVGVPLSFCFLYITFLMNPRAILGPPFESVALGPC